jgi:ribosomal-protein-alanine N-acetyltransferase
MELNAKSLKTKRLLLRPFAPGDGPGMFASYCHDEEVCRYLTWNPHPCLADTEAFLNFKLAEQKEPYHYDWLITKEGRIIGSINVVKIYPEQGFEIGYCLERKSWGFGYMSEAFHAVLTYLFDSGYHYAIMKAQLENSRSRHVIEKQGFHYDHDDQEEVPLKKKTVTVAVYQLNQEEFIR